MTSGMHNESYKSIRVGKARVGRYLSGFLHTRDNPTDQGHKLDNSQADVQEPARIILCKMSIEGDDDVSFGAPCQAHARFLVWKPIRCCLCVKSDPALHVLAGLWVHEECG